jgi:hypothetical protein
MAGSALPATTARNRRVHGHGCTGERPIVDNTADLVPEDKRPGQLRVADSTLFEPMQVRAADADVGDAYQRLVGARDRRVFVVQSDISPSMQPYHAH